MMREAGQFTVFLGVLLVLPNMGRGETVHRHPLGTGGLQFLRGPASVRYEEREHGLSREYAHKGDFSETIRVTAGEADPVSKPFLHYVYLTPRAPIAPELRASLWLRARTAGPQLLARVVFPRLRNPQRPEEAYSTHIEGSRYANANNWQRLELGDVSESLRRRIQTMRIEFGAEVDATGAYIDQLVLNLYDGVGEVQVWINEIEIGPVIEQRDAAPGPIRTVAVTERRRGPLVEITRDQLLVDGQRFFFRGIRLTDTPVKSHKLAGFNCVFLEPDAPGAIIDEVARQELFAIPTLNLAADEGPAVTVARRGEEMARDRLNRFLNQDRLLFWYLGGGRDSSQIEPVARTASMVRDADPERPIAVGAWDGLRPYSRHVDLLGVHRWPLHTSLELPRYRDWLNQRRLLARPGTFTWTWIQTHLPDWHTQLVYGRGPGPAFDEPIGPQPEHLRLLSYIALSAGCRGIGYWSDRFLADSHQGRDRLLAVALLNLEMQMLEPVLLSIIKSPVWIDTSNPNVKAAVLYGDRGILVLPIWLGPGSQYVPGQAAAAGLRLTVPLIPPNFQPYEVTPADVRSLVPRRVAGGSEIVLHDFSLTAAIVFTGDMTPGGPLVYWQEQVKKMARPASEWTLDLARFELEKVKAISAQLAQQAPPITGSTVLLRDAENRLTAAKAFFDAGRHREAYHEANRALRPVRQLMRLQWDQAIAALATPTASPYAVSYFTLPRHWSLLTTLKRSSFGENMLRGGNFESPDQGWSVTQTTLDEVATQARYNGTRPREGSQCLELAVTPRDGGAGLAPLERTFVAVNSPAVTLPAGSLVRISAWIRVPTAITASADGALFYDSAGGEPLSVRLTDASEWRNYTLYRRVPSSGQIFVTLALTGVGRVQFDDVRIEPAQ